MFDVIEVCDLLLWVVEGVFFDLMLLFDFDLVVVCIWFDVDDKLFDWFEVECEEFYGCVCDVYLVLVFVELERFLVFDVVECFEVIVECICVCVGVLFG